ncbi:MAG: hypothetical protein JW870_10955, partial [Candidatus Delongbacteria bacterium]|nr:hypothetical protein [Candidatus Delongbacteria bacterium]
SSSISLKNNFFLLLSSLQVLRATQIAHNGRRYAQLPFLGARLSCYPKDSQMNQHEQPFGPAIAYDRMLAVVHLLVYTFIHCF